MNKIYNEDCMDTIKRNLNYHYVITSPPDYNELNYTPITDDATYIEFLTNVFEGLKPKNNVITIIVSNRKYKRKTIMKNRMMTDIMLGLGYFLINEKIWIKTDKVDLFRYGFSYVMSFGKKPFKSKGTKLYRADVFNDKVQRHKKYSYQFSETTVKRFVENFTDEDEIVYDPFIGIGTTAVACSELNRKYLGSEIDTEVYNLSKIELERLSKKFW